MNYIEYQFIVSPKEIGAEILVAELGEVGFECLYTRRTLE